MLKKIRLLVLYFFAVYSPARHIKPEYITDKLLRHNPPRKFIELRRWEITPDKINRLRSHLETDLELLAFVSRVKLQGKDKYFHLPLIDFHCEPSAQNLKRLRNFLKEIKQEGGVILSSGAPYHYYGFKPLSELNWTVFLGQCLLSELVDQFYIGHQLIDKCSILRISQSNQYPRVPVVVSVLEKAGR